MKIFGSGLQRTGTMSLTRGLNHLQIKAKQFPKELAQDLHHPIINQFDAFTDFPIPLLYQELDKTYPGSKFIHTIRDEQAWLKSVQWLFSTGAVKFNLEKNQFAQTFHQQFYGINHFDEAIFLRRYREHNAEVAAYFADRPDDFLVIDLTAGEGYEKICPFLGLPVPNTPFPRSNSSQDLTTVRAAKLKKSSRKQLRTFLQRTRLKPLFQSIRGILSPLPLNSPPERLSCQPFFIVSTGRSGSTLLRAILNQHPAICIPPESHRLGSIVTKFQKDYRFQSWSHLAALVAAEFQQARGFAYWQFELTHFFRQAEILPKKDQNLASLIDLFYNHYRQIHKPEAVRWGDKTIGTIQFLPEVEALFPAAQYIHIIRDGRDVATSLFNQGVYPNPVASADAWMTSVATAREFGNRLPASRFLEIRYEDLVQEPELTIRQVSEFLSLDYQPQMLDFQGQVDKLGDTNRPLHENLKKPINPSAIGKWKQSLSAVQQAEIIERLAPMLNSLGYENN